VNDILRLADEMAADLHSGQFRRHSNSPYIVHPRRVMQRLKDAGVTDDEVLAAALLHDVLEDCPRASEALLAMTFGPRVTDLVKDLTKPTHTTRRAYVESFRFADPWACLVKLSDRLDNVLDWPPESVKWYAEEAQRILQAVEANPAPHPTRDGFPEAWATIHAELTQTAARLTA
jgi:(p)ppGpp synthase/HD superfamily hydrolase